MYSNGKCLVKKRMECEAGGRGRWWRQLIYVCERVTERSDRHAGATDSYDADKNETKRVWIREGDESG